MAKVAKPKSNPLNNPRSRAARRAGSPSLNTDKSIKEAPRASDATPVLAPYRGGGVQKKQKKKQMSHAQRLRHERGLARAEAIQDQLENKVADAKTRLRTRQSRRALWDDVNAVSKDEARKAIKGPGRFATLNGEDDDQHDLVEAFPGDTEIKVLEGVQVPSYATGENLTFAMGPALSANTKKPGTFGVASKPPPTSGIVPNEPVQEPTSSTPQSMPASSAQKPSEDIDVIT